MAVDYDVFMGRLLPDVPGCPEIAALQSLQDATIKFCEMTLIHQVDHDPISVVAKITDYDLETPVKNTRIVKVMRAFYKSQELLPAAPDQVRDPTVYNQRIGGVETSYSTPQFFIQKDSASISLLPIPDQTLPSALTIRVALAPTRTATVCEDFLFEQWADVIVAGAAADLQMSFGRPYSNPQMGGLSQMKFTAGINAARMKANRGYNRSNLSVQLRKI